jgi:type IV pilus assembly protein PilM
MPFYKRELSFKRRRPTVAAVEAQPVAEPVVADEALTVAEPTAAPVVAEPIAVDEPSIADERSVAEEPSVVAAEPIELEPVAVEEAMLEVAAVAEEPVFFDEPVVTVDGTAEPVAELVDEAPMFFDEEPAVAELPVEEVVAVVEPEVHAEQPVEVAFDEPAEADAVEHPVDEVAAGAGKGRKGGSVRLNRGGGSPRPKKAKKSSGPKGRGKRVLGLKIGASQIAAAVTQESGGRHELLQLVRLPIESGLVVDGEVKDVERLAEILKAFVEEHDLPKSNVRIGLASNRIGVRTVEISGIDDQERFDNAVRFKAHEVLPVAFNESVLDYRVVGERPIESGQTSKRVLLVVAPRDQVQPYVDLCAKAGLRLTGIDLEALGLLRTFVEAHPIGFRAGDDTATVVVALGHESTTLLVAGGGVCDFTRVFDWGGETLQNAIATELDVDHAQAADILKHLSITGRGSDSDTLSEDQRLRANEAIRTRLTPFARELVSSLQFYQTQPDSLGIGELIITGGTAHLSGLAEALHQMIGVSVRFGDPLARLVSLAEIPDSLHARIGSMAVPIGLAIEDAPWRTVNLLPEELRNTGRRKPNVLAIAAPAVAAVSLFALGFTFIGAHGDASDAQKALDDVQAQIAALPTPKGPTIDPALQAAQVARAQSVATVLGGRLAWEPFFRDLARALPGNVWLEHVTALAPEATASVPLVAAANTTAPVPTGVTIDGFTYSQADVALLLARLQAIPSLKSVTLKSARHELKGAEGNKTDVVSFSIIADLNGGAQ